MHCHMPDFLVTTCPTASCQLSYVSLLDFFLFLDIFIALLFYKLS